MTYIKQKKFYNQMQEYTSLYIKDEILILKELPITNLVNLKKTSIKLSNIKIKNKIFQNLQKTLYYYYYFQQQLYNYTFDFKDLFFKKKLFGRKFLQLLKKKN